jgi:predicted TIM-barrel fold metal-dependent hydrolase
MIDGRQLSDPTYDLLWQRANDLELPVCVHNLASTGLRQLSDDRSFGFLVNHAFVHPAEAMAAFGSLYEADVFSRYPNLRFGFMESGSGWVPFWLDRLEEHFEQVGWSMNPKPKLSPMDAFTNRCIVGCEGEDSMVPYVQDHFGLQSVIWASDYPHYDTEAPYVRDMRNRTDLSDAQREGSLRLAAIRFFDLPWDTIVSSNAARRSRKQV